MPRRIAAGLLLAASLAGGTAAHRHSILAEDSGSSAPAPQVVTSHRGPSTAPHAHAIVLILEGDSCWACQSHRVFTVSRGVPIPDPVRPGKTAALRSPLAAASVARFARLSRGPPSLL